MGQVCAKGEAHQLLLKDLALPVSANNIFSNHLKNVNTFVAVSSLKWLHAVSMFGKIISDGELENLVSNERILQEILQPSYVLDSTSSLMKIRVTVLKKEIEFSMCFKNGGYPVDNDHSILDLLEMISKHERKCLTEYLSQFSNVVSKDECLVGKTLYWNDLKVLLKQVFQVSVKLLCSNISSKIVEQDINPMPSMDATHFLPLLTVLESDEAVYILEPFPLHNLSDAFSYSPAILGKNHTSLMFLVYQLLNVFLTLRKLHAPIKPDITLHDFYLLHDSLWISVSPMKCIQICSSIQHTPIKQQIIQIYAGIQTDLRDQSITLKEKLSFYTNAWCGGDISNFDYLVIINKLAGRKFRDPLNHPVFPWVTDFTYKHGGFRDLKKTKFRLNKGDRQLDATYSTGIDAILYGYTMSQPVQHHVSDILSDITYYIYQARNTPKEILCYHVRSRWVPDEYPASMERMFEWTPDECIPEFFYDTNIFKSIHSDLPDLGLPDWLSTPGEFVEYHHQLLESSYVSKYLHHWIDLVFGYKLEGLAARQEKNVHLSLVDGHKDLKKYGIVQLFTNPHPRCRIHPDGGDFSDGCIDAAEACLRDVSASWEYVDLTSSMKKTKDEDEIVQTDQEDFLKRKKTKSFYEGGTSATTSSSDDDIVTVVHQIAEIKNVSFMDSLEVTEEMLLHEISINPPDQFGIGTFKLGSVFENKKTSSELTCIDDDVKVIACLCIETVLQKELRIRTYIPPLEDRLHEDLKFLYGNHSVPSWIVSSIENVLGGYCQTDTETLQQLPSVSCPVLNSLVSGFHFPSYFTVMHGFLAALYTTIHKTAEDRSKILSELESCAQQLPYLLDELDYEGVDVLLLYLLPLFAIENIRVIMFLHIFSPLSVALGPAKSRAVFLKDLQKIYDGIKSAEEIALLQQSFLSNVLSSFGQDAFLQLLLGVILDTLTSQQVESNGTPIFQTSSSLSVSVSNELTYKSNSLISYEVSPCFAGEVDSLASLNLDSIFVDNSQNLVILSKDYTNSIEEACNLPNDDADIVQSQAHDGLRSSSSLLDVKNTSSDETTLTDEHLPVISSQEIHSMSGMESLIDIDTTSASLINFSHPALAQFEKDTNTATIQDLTSILLVNNEKENVPSNGESHSSAATKSPFTVLLTDHSIAPSEGLEQAEEMLEEVPQDEEINIQDNISANSSGNIDIFQTVVDSLKWLIPWLGPLLTTEFIANPLIKKLSKLLLDYDGNDSATEAVECLLEKASPIIECLIEVALIYGDNIVLYLYLPHIGKLIESAITMSSVSILLGSNLMTSIQLMTDACKLLQAESILTHMEVFSVEFFQPLIRLLSTVKPFSTGSVIKEFLSRKLIDILGLLCQKLKREIAQDIMAPLLQQFFSCFDGIYALKTSANGTTFISRKYSLLCQSFEVSTEQPTAEVLKKKVEEGKILQSHSDEPHTTNKFSGFDETDHVIFPNQNERVVKNVTMKNVTIDDILESDKVDTTLHDEQFADVYDTFSPSLAYHAYVLFCRVMGTLYIEKTLYNSDLVWHLCTKHDEGLTLSSMGNKSDSSNENATETDGQITRKRKRKWYVPIEQSTEEETRLTKRSPWQHVDGSWFEHWKLTQRDGSNRFGFRFGFDDCKLQTYAGHSSAIRDIYIPDNEHYFLSASRDKTVKLWLLKNHGNGTAHLGCSRTYDNHTRAVFVVQGIESKRFVASCDGLVHIWDPVSGSTVSEFDAGRGHTITSVRTLPSPSTCVAVATTEGNMRLYDVRQKRFAQEWKFSLQPSTGMVRSMCVNTNSTWIAAGFSSGIVSVMDLQAGIFRGQARVHDGEILQMEPVPGIGFISSSNDSNLRLWHEDGSVSHILKTSNETVHTVVFSKQQLLWASTTNKFTIHNSDKMSSFHSYRINQESFKGTLSKMAVLPINQLYLFGTDNGNVLLYA